MPERLTSRLAKSSLVLLCLAAGLVGPATAGADPTSAQCDARNNNSADKLLPCIQTNDLWDHMKAFQAIARREPGPGRPSVAQLGRTRVLAIGAVRRAEDEGRRI